MTVADWIDESKQRYRTQAATAATAESVRKFIDGAVDRVVWAFLSRVSPVYTTKGAGETVHYFVESQKELKRARNAIDEEPVLEWVMEPVDKDTVFWDVGAYHGTFSTIAAVKGATTVAFEPHAENMARLERNVALNDVSVNQFDVALSNQNTTKSFGTGQTPNSELKIKDDGETTVQTVQGDKIGPRPDVIKIDVEGHEIAVLEGVTDHLQTVDRVVVEVHNGVPPADVSDMLQDAGLRTTDIETNRSQTYIGGVRL